MTLLYFVPSLSTLTPTVGDSTCHPLDPTNMAAVEFVTGYITNYVDGMVRPYVEQGAAAVGDVAGGVLFTVCAS